MRLSLFILLAAACDGGPTSPDAGRGGLSDAGPVVMRDVPRAVTVARATAMPTCTIYVDAANMGVADGTAASPYATIGAAVDAASDGAVICVAEGVYAETLTPLDKAFTLAGGFQSGQLFAVRDSSVYVTRAQGNGTGSFLRIEGDAAPGEGELTAIDGFEITGYEQGVVRATYFPQRFDLTNNYIHDNRCPAGRTFGGGFLLSNVSGTIARNVISNNTCGFGGGGALIVEAPLTSAVTVEQNRVEGNSGEDVDCHGGGLYLRATELTIAANDFVGNRCASWGGGLYVGAEPPQLTTARISWNLYRGNRAENSGGGFFCDDAATCNSDHEIFDGNCGGNILLDSGSGGPTVASFDHMTNYGALAVGCGEPGPAVIVNKASEELDTYTFTSSIFFGNGNDMAAFCDSGCATLTIGVTYSALTIANSGNATVTFGEGNLDGIDPLFADAQAGDFHLRSTFGRWTPTGYVTDDANSPAIAAGAPAGDTSQMPDRAGDRSEMGAYGNSAEASYVR